MAETKSIDANVADDSFGEVTPELLHDLSDAAAFLLPLAKAHLENGSWPLEVVAWLVMVRDSLSVRCPTSTH